MSLGDQGGQLRGATDVLQSLLVHPGTGLHTIRADHERFLPCILVCSFSECRETLLILSTRLEEHEVIAVSRTLCTKLDLRDLVKSSHSSPDENIPVHVEYAGRTLRPDGPKRRLSAAGAPDVVRSVNVSEYPHYRRTALAFERVTAIARIVVAQDLVES